MIFLTTRYILGKKNTLADQLSHPDQVLPTEWSPLPWVFKDICKKFSHLLIDLFAARANVKLLLYVSPVPIPMVWREDAFQHRWDSLNIYAFPLLAFLRQILLRATISRNLSMILATSLWLQKQWFASFLSLLVDVHLELAML